MIVMTYALIGDESGNAAYDCADGSTLTMTGSYPNQRSGSRTAADNGRRPAGVIVAIPVSMVVPVTGAIIVAIAVVAVIVVAVIVVAMIVDIVSLTVVLLPIVAVLGGLGWYCYRGQRQAEDAENRDPKNAFHNYLRLYRWALYWRGCQTVQSLIGAST